jgi:hypothetical protein
MEIWMKGKHQGLVQRKRNPSRFHLRRNARSQVHIAQGDTQRMQRAGSLLVSSGSACRMHVFGV